MAKPRSKGVQVYTNLVARHKAKKDRRSRQKAEYLATLPKHPALRALYRLHPRRVFGYLFSREGAIMMAKVAGVGCLLLVLMIGALFAYYRRELDAIRPSELAKRVNTTVSRYYDRNGVLLWEDKGAEDYRLVIESNQIPENMKEATIAIEDRDFYKHKGISVTGIARAAINNFRGDSVQGGSTLTQQLVKQVFLADEAQERGVKGIPRKIKETILAIEVERMYNKDQILTLYLNMSSYGGRRNGVESAAQTYFGKPAKDLTLAEAALLASIPQRPGYYNPYYALGDSEARESLLNRQHTTLDYMVEQGFITKKQASEAKQVAVLNTVQPESEQFKDIKAPHFVQMVKRQLESELGAATVGNGGLTVKTTLDYRMQQIVDEEMDGLFTSGDPGRSGFTNAAATAVDAPTGQILAMRGSRDYNYPGFGEINMATSYLQPGSSIKPFVYSELFKQKAGVNYGAGSILSDEPLPQSVYRTDGKTPLQNFDGKFRGAIPIRNALGESRNVPAVKAILVNGLQPTINTIHDMGNKAYCTQEVAGPSAAIGTCSVLQTEHANAYATLARGGVYKPVAAVLEVKNAEGTVIKKWTDSSKQVIDPQIAYIINDILTDDAARSATFGRGAAGFNVPGVKTGTKTGTTNMTLPNNTIAAKDLWMMSYSPKIALGIWVGNNTPAPLRTSHSSILGRYTGKMMERLHKNVEQPDGTWKPGEWFTSPAGVQKLAVNGRTDLFPSWFNKSNSSNGTVDKVTFDRISKKKATDCTPESTKVVIEVVKTTDPVTKKETITVPDGYDINASDDVHTCSDADKPFIQSIKSDKKGNTYTITVDVSSRYPIESVAVQFPDGTTQNAAGNGTTTYSFTFQATGSVSGSVNVTVTDNAGYSTSGSKQLQ